MSKWLSRHQESDEKSRLKNTILHHILTGGMCSCSMYGKGDGEGQEEKRFRIQKFKGAETALPTMFTVTEVQSQEEPKGR